METSELITFKQAFATMHRLYIHGECRVDAAVWSENHTVACVLVKFNDFHISMHICTFQCVTESCSAPVNCAHCFSVVDSQ